MKKNILILLTILTFSCTSNDENTKENTNFDVISKGALHGAGNEGIMEQNLIITDSDAWTSLVNQMDFVNNVSNSFSEVAIDFSEFTVIAVFQDVKSNGGYGLDMEITTDSKSIFVDITELVPGVEDNVTTVVTQPYYIVKIPKTDLSIVFKNQP